MCGTRLFLMGLKMIINRELVNRALLKAGQTVLTEADIENNSEAWKTVKEFYLSTMLETLTRTPWTSAKTRARLELTEGADNLSVYANMYTLPVDCARALKLNSGEPFIVEDKYLYTNDENPILLYITNGKIDGTVEVPAEPPATNEPSNNNGPDEIEDTTVPEGEPSEEENNEQTEEPSEENTDPEEPEEDIPGYRTLEYDPNFWEYVETRIASKMVLKITGDMQLYSLLFSEASVIEQTAAKASKAAGKSKPAGQNYWTDEIVGSM